MGDVSLCLPWEHKKGVCEAASSTAGSLGEARCQAFPPGVTAIANYTRRHCVLLQGAGEAVLEWKFRKKGVESVAFRNWVFDSTSLSLPFDLKLWINWL